MLFNRLWQGDHAGIKQYEDDTIEYTRQSIYLILRRWLSIEHPLFWQGRLAMMETYFTIVR